MKLLKDLKQPSFLVSIILSLSLAVLVFFLVEQVTTFSGQVTNYYAPTIHAIKDFSHATSHVKRSMDGGEAANPSFSKQDVVVNGGPSITTVYHLRTSTERLKDLVDNWPPKAQKHIEEMLAEAESVIARISQNGDQRQIYKDIEQLSVKSAKHVRLHEEELVKARKGIKSSATQIRIVAFLLLGLGIALSFREIRIRELRDRNHEKVAAIKVLVSSLDARDPYTMGHSERVANFAVTVGKTMGISKKILEQLYLAGLMHDIGKIAVSDKVLLKHERLNSQEFQEMKKHPAATAKIISNIEALHDILPWTLYHHERFDGKGYPEGKKGDDIPLPAQILAIADSFDAMTSSRPYRPAMSFENAIIEIKKNKGLQWRADVVEAFLSSVGKAN